MRPKQLVNDKKYINISFDFNQYQFPATTKNRTNKNQQQTQISQIESTSQRKRVLNRVSNKITPSFNFSTQISQTSKKLTQPTSNFTDKSNSSIEILKEQQINNDFKLQNIRKQHFHTQANQSKEKEQKNIQIQTELDETKQNDSIERVKEFKAIKCIQYPQFYSIYGRVKKQSSRDSQILQKALSNILNESASPRNCKEIDWNEIKVPLTQKECLKQFGNYLTSYEKIEIQQYSQIYCIGCQAQKQQSQMTQYNDGFDDARGEYIINIHDHIGYRFEILQVIGKGSFGQALKVFDHQKKILCCLKIIRNKLKFYKQAKIELEILNYIREKDDENLTNLIKITDHLVFRNHMCLCFELLSMNLYQLLKTNSFSGFSLELIRRFSIQLLNALNFLQQHNIIHCDLKPENILLKCSNKSGIKIIDFGSSCFEDQKIYTYIQSRYYRAPEVILGLPYTKSIDMWSFGCVLAELYLGYPIFPGENEQEQISLFLEALGLPDQDMLQGAERRKLYFKDNPPYKPLLYQNKRGKVRLPGSRSISDLLKCDDSSFIDFIQKCLVWNPKRRMKPVDGLLHIFILQGLPSEIRQQHINYVEKELLSQNQKRKYNYSLDNEKRFQFNFTSEPEMCKNQENQFQFKKKQLYQSKLPPKELETEDKQIIIPKKNSFSLHSNKNQKQVYYTNYFPDTTKSFIMKTNQFN